MFWQGFKPASVDVTKQWKETLEAAPVHKQFISVSIPAFSVSGLTWGGASVISHEFPATLPNTFSIRLPFVAPSNPNFCLAVRFGSPVQRFKIWGDVGENLVFPIYNGETIETSCVFEIWTIATSTITSSIMGLNIDLSIVFERTGCNASSLAAQIASNLVSSIGADPLSVTVNPYTPTPLPLVLT